MIYEKLVLFTRDLVSKIDCNRYIYFDQQIEEGIFWQDSLFLKRIQEGKDLGEKMLQAFKDCLADYKRVLIIGSDCPYLSKQIIDEAFAALNENDLVIGPTEDGGYYLLGMKSLHSELFSDINWSTPMVFQSTLKIIHQKKLNTHILEKLSDIDFSSDWKTLGWEV